jgi:thioredoxin reductase (NADPH)
MTEDFDVIVAGGGIGGLTAALHAARAGRSTLVLGGNAPGGLLLSIEKIEGVPGFPEGVPGYDLCPMLQEQAEEAGAEFRMEELAALAPVDDGWRLNIAEGGPELEARGVILATGARLKHLGVPGE